MVTELNKPKTLGPTQYSALKLWEIRGALGKFSTHCSHKQIEDAFIEKTRKFVLKCPVKTMKQLQSKLDTELHQIGVKKDKATIHRLVTHWTPSEPDNYQEMDILLMLINETAKLNSYKETKLQNLKKERPALCFLVMAKLGQMYAEEETLQVATEIWETWNSKQ